MLPAPLSRGSRLAEVMPSVLASVRSELGSLRLPPARSVIVLVVDGLGERMLRSRAGHARTLAAAPSSPIASGFPTTTAAALASLTTGTDPGTHGLVGYTALEPSSGRVINQLTGWDEMPDAAGWQRSSTIFEQAAHAGVSSVAVGAERYRDSGFTRAVLRGADYLAAKPMADRLALARERLGTNGGGIAYVYVPELDQAGHRYGWESDRWLGALEELDSAVASFTRRMPEGEGMLVTADHGMVDIPGHRHVFVDALPGLLDGVEAIAGEPRCLQLHLEATLTVAERDEVLARWRRSESHRSWVVTRDEAISHGWFGPEVHSEVRPRIGDILVAARKEIAYYDARTASESGLAMVGQHGSLSDDEVRIPLVRFGVYR